MYNDWSDFDSLRHSVKHNTVDRLKHILSGFNEECGTHLSKSGKKQEIIDRIVNTLDSWRQGNFEDKWTKAKSIMQQVRVTGTYAPPGRAAPLLTTFPAAHVQSNVDSTKHAQYSSSVAGSSSRSLHYDPYAPPRRPAVPSTSTPSTSASGPGIRFKDSPFFRIDQTVSHLVECPESTSATDRRQQALNFTLTADQAAKISSGSQYQLRLFCTSSIFYAGIGSFRSNALACPIEFPPTCEVRVNNTQITANLKGLKKKPGTAPPPDLNKYARTGVSNKVEMVYVNSQQPIQSKKYYMIVMLVEATTIKSLVNNLRGQHIRPAFEVRERMVQALTEDDDIIAGPQKMSLKCPLTFVRIETPCRSSKCVHPQCFDATSWYTMMEQTTTWLCPVCERVLDHKDLIMDGYFDEILKETPESVEDVIVEADGEWHTSDNKYGSAKWKASHPVVSKPPTPKKVPTPAAVPSCPPAGANGKGKAPNVEILVVDSDDEDEGRVKRELSPSSATQSFEGTLPPASQANTDVIDLTLDDSDDEPIVSRAQSKRKALEAELDHPPASDQAWKKTRVDLSSRILPPPARSTANGAPPLHTSAGGVSNHSRSPTSPVPGRYPSSFAGNTLPPPNINPSVYNQYNTANAARNGASNPSSFQLPPINNSTFVPGQSQHARWRAS
ncbi:hypothetical protein CPC08DRAFT_813495 [Agrocybe pediades]|nr:hypothetical protein CPC08DRAFT_813495 [Agrocybe pediades]